MKFLTLAFASFFTLALHAQGPEVVTAPVDHLFIPSGFDNNDNVELVVTGKFPNPCFSRNLVKTTVKGDVIHVTVTSLSKDDRRLAMCEPLKVPFKEIITIGNLQGGDYKVVVNGGTKFELQEKLTVAMSSSQSIDDYLYPMVEYVELGFMGGLSGDAVLIAKLPSSCLALDRVEYMSNGKDSLSVMPILKKISSNCPEHKTSLEIPIKFNVESFKHEKILLFVRTIDGKSVHNLVEKE